MISFMREGQQYLCHLNGERGKWFDTNVSKKTIYGILKHKVATGVAFLIFCIGIGRPVANKI